MFFIGVVTLGDPATAGRPIPPGVVATEYEYSCSAECTSKVPELNVFGSLFHMHELGSRVRIFQEFSQNFL
jgi:hypothetical protein